MRIKNKLIKVSAAQAGLVKSVYSLISLYTTLKAGPYLRVLQSRHEAHRNKRNMPFTQKKQKKRNLDYSCDDSYFVRYCYVCYGDKGLKVLGP